MTADALATTLFVMGPDDGLPWLRREFPGVEAYFVVREGAKDALREAETTGFRAATSYERRTAK
jgi:thiamine biosynthesis lipoprotein ApbE